ncbi:MAG TPA: glycosyltransferase [Acidobacteriota bacterium]
MRILLIAYYYPPLQGPGVTRAVNLVKYLRRAGHDVSVLTQSYGGDRTCDRELLRVHDPSFNCRRRGWRRLAWFCRRVRVEILNRSGIYASIFGAWKNRVLAREDKFLEITRPDVILATYPPVETLQVAMRLAKKAALPLIADFRDGLLFEAIESKRLRRFACVRKAYTEIERRAAAAAAALVTVSEPLSDYFRRTYGHARVITVANGFDPDESAMPLPEVTLEPGCLHIVHSGRCALSDASCSIAPLVQAVHALLAVRPELARTLRLHFLGELSRREKRLLAGLARRGVARLHGQVSRPLALAYQRRAGVLLLVTSPDRSSVATAKIFEYLQARRPVLALTGHTTAAAIVVGTRSGWVVSPRFAPEIEETLERLIDDPGRDRRVDLSAAAVQNFSFAAGLGPLLEVLRAMQKGAD